MPGGILLPRRYRNFQAPAPRSCHGLESWTHLTTQGMTGTSMSFRPVKWPYGDRTSPGVF